MYYICSSQQENLELGEKRKQQELLQQVSIVLPRNLCFLLKYRQGNLCKIPLLRCKLLLFLELGRDKAGAAKVVIENCVEGCTTRFSKFPFQTKMTCLISTTCAACWSFKCLPF